MGNERTVTLTEKELVEVLAQASANHAKDLMSAAESKGDVHAATGAGLSAILIGAALAREVTDILFPPAKGDTEAKPEGEQ